VRLTALCHVLDCDSIAPTLIIDALALNFDSWLGFCQELPGFLLLLKATLGKQLVG